MTLAKRYQLTKLAKMTSDALQILAITRDNMIFTAAVAKNYKGFFDDLSKLTVKCLGFRRSLYVPISFAFAFAFSIDIHTPEKGLFKLDIFITIPQIV